MLAPFFIIFMVLYRNLESKYITVNTIKMKELDRILAFLGAKTPDQWVQTALVNQELLLIDHAHCEKKAASTAITLLYRYVAYPDLLHQMSRLAREELRHFEQVLKILEDREIEYIHLTASRYMKGLIEHVRNAEPARLIDTLIIGAFVEARSCERFAAIAPHLDDELNNFYTRLLRSEARHFENYLDLAEKHSEEPLAPRIDYFRDIENVLISSPDTEFRFHSGV